MKSATVFTVVLLCTASLRAQSTVDSAQPYAWGANIGWTNWRASAADGVAIGEYVCSGFIYGANVGWVNMGSGAPADGIRYGNAAANDFGVNVFASTVPGVAVLRGFAYGANIGWINFEQTGNPQLDLTNGRLSGYAWSANCGWLNLGSDTPYGVTSSSIADASDTDSDGIADAFEYEYFGGLTTADAISDADGDGASDLAEYRADTNPRDRDNALNIIAFTRVPGGASDTDTLTFTSGTSRLYRIEILTDLSPGPWLDSGLGAFFGDGATTMRAIQLPATPRRFYRVVADRPLTP